jgi:mannose-6-phosphate isomerase
MKLSPARLEPVFSPRPWGSLSLAPLFPDKTSLLEPLGEAWMTGDACVFANGPFAGKNLGEAWPQMPVEWTGTDPADRTRSFPLLVKFIFAEEKLSVQVHPDDIYASKYEEAQGGRGKTEMWYAVKAREGTEVLVGLKPHVTAESFREAIANGTAEEALAHIPLHEGEAIFVPAGTAHTIGPGLVLCEIQQQSDLTYRVYDYNRRDAQGLARALHIDKAIEVIRFGEQKGGKVASISVAHDSVNKTFFTACPYFTTERWEFDASLPAKTSSAHLDLLIFLEGQGEITWGHECAPYQPAQTWLLPAALGEYQLVPAQPTKLLRAYVPCDLNAWAGEMQALGFDEATCQRLLHR